jgi:tetratricopeptide (TPR) repeat protein/TolB-like protein
MTDRQILDSWKEISEYLKRDARTCQRYERKYGLPVHRIDGSPKARVFAYKDEIDAWMEKGLGRVPSPVVRILDLVRSSPLSAFLLLVLTAGTAVLVYVALSGLFRGRDRVDRLTIVLLPFQNATGRSDMDECARGIPQLMAEDLSGSGYFTVIPQDRTMGVFRELGLAPEAPVSSDDLRRIGKKSGATHAVMGTVFEDGDGLLVTLSTRSIRSDGTYPSRFTCPDRAGLAVTAVRMADQIKKDLGLTRRVEAGDYDTVQMPITTSSLRTFRLYNEGRRLHLRGDYAASARTMRKAIAYDPEFALAWRSLAASLNSQGAAAEAERCLEKAVEHNQNASAQERYFIRATYFQIKGEFGAARLVTQEWCALYPDDTQAWLMRGRGDLFEEDMEEARTALNEGLRKGDRNPFTFFYASLACTSLARFDEAARIREQGMSVHPMNRLIASAGSIDALVQGYWDRALTELEGMEGIMPRLLLEIRRGDTLLLKGDFHSAENAYASVKRISPHALTRLARLAIAEGRYGRAAKLAAKAGDDELLAYIESRRGRHSAAIEAATKALQEGRARSRAFTEPIALLLKGAVEVHSGDLKAARVSLAQIETTDLKGLKRTYERNARCLAGIIAEAEGRPEQAVEEFEGAVALLSMDIPYIDDMPYSVGVVAEMQAMILYLTAQAHERIAQQEAALERYLRLIGLSGGRLTHPDLYALSHYAVGRIRQAKGDITGARASLERFLDLWKDADPGLPEVEDAKKRLL